MAVPPYKMFVSKRGVPAEYRVILFPPKPQVRDRYTLRQCCCSKYTWEWGWEIILHTDKPFYWSSSATVSADDPNITVCRATNVCITPNTTMLADFPHVPPMPFPHYCVVGSSWYGWNYGVHFSYYNTNVCRNEEFDIISNHGIFIPNVMHSVLQPRPDLQEGVSYMNPRPGLLVDGDPYDDNPVDGNGNSHLTENTLRGHNGKIRFLMEIAYCTGMARYNPVPYEYPSFDCAPEKETAMVEFDTEAEFPPEPTEELDEHDWNVPPFRFYQQMIKGAPFIDINLAQDPSVNWHYYNQMLIRLTKIWTKK